MSEHPLEPLNKMCDINPDTLSETADASRRYRYIDLSSIKEQKADLSIAPELFADLPSRARRKVRCNDVLLGTVRPNLKNFALIDSDEDDLLCSTGFAVLRSKEDISDPRFIFQAINSEVVERQLNALVTGSNYPAVNASQVAELLIPVPPLPEQKKIAEILSGIDQQILFHQKRLEKNQRLTKGVLSEMLARIEEVSRDSKKSVEDIFRETSTPERHESETPLYSLTIESGLVPKPDRYVRDFLLTDKEKENYKLITKGDFAMNPMNLRWGAISAFHEESTAKISKYYTTFRARDIRTSVRLYEFLFRSDQYIRLYERIATGSLIEKMRVNWSAFRKLEIPFPPLEVQNDFESLSSSLELVNSRTQVLIAKLKEFRSALAFDLLSGRKRVSV
ncbi:restriction endonuclease subunit S [Synechococcus sp. CCY9202]|uniref:restriction endonuclease subunit S n=1 Tax=Synechococcus sp. CCY9202 TaxID=174698 RepID=UPI002B21651B|nr:restriction endonuclease subunit S [Synechococcus sp. CCY9202]MEA5424213.1 restriction endonuclease subunit S [Synechococcus sp. CCY9202]